MATVLYHCPCTSVPSTSAVVVTSVAGTPLVAPPPQHPSHQFGFHKLPNLYFCEECDAIRCNRCVSIEVSGYYCPNCLFEVPSASVRAEKNRCARNCFQCPHCSNTLSIVSSDPPPNPDPRLPPVVGAVGEPPFFLYCNFCRWDSAEAGITFDKPTGLALQLQKTEDTSADTLEFERLKEHFDPLTRINQSQGGEVTGQSGQRGGSTRNTPLSVINAAASSALSRDMPGVRRKGQRPGENGGRAAPATAASASHKDDFSNAVYKSRIDTASTGVSAQSEVDWLREITQEEFSFGEVAPLEDRWLGSWSQSMKASELRPLRIPLRSKQTKRCHKCRHILIKPEQKSQSIRYKLKLMAANYLPSIDVLVLFPSTLQGTSTIQTPRSVAAAKAKQGGGSTGTSDTGPDAKRQLQQGKTYPFHLAFQNPLYEPIQVRLVVQRPSPPGTSPGISSSTLSPMLASARNRRPPFAVSLPTTNFGIAPFAEAWEYDDEGEDEFDDDDIEDMLAGRSGTDKEKASPSRGDSKGAVGVLERKANITRVGGEVIIGRDGSGPIKFNVLVTYTYRADDPSEEAPSPSKAAAASTKSFSFYVCIDLGVIAAQS